MSKRIEFAGFRPSFLSAGLGWTRDLFEEAFTAGSAEILPDLDALADRTIDAEGVVGAGIERSLRFGHLPDGADAMATDLSGAAAYRLHITFDEKDKLSAVALTLFLLNPRMLLSEDFLVPARREADGQFVALTDEHAPCGLILLAEPELLPAARFAGLIKDLPKAALADVPDGARAYDEDHLVARLDLSLAWDETLIRYATDILGETIGKPNAAFPPEMPVTAIRLFSPILPDPIDALMDSSKSIGIAIPADLVGGAEIIFDTPIDADRKQMLAKALAEFNLQPDFRGILFEGLRIAWLDDNQYGASGWPEIGLSLSAFSFGGADKSTSFSKWYVSFEAALPPARKSSYLGMFDTARIRVSLAQDEVRHASLTGVFGKLDEPYAWLSTRRATLSLFKQPWTDAQGQRQGGMGISLGLEAGKDDVLATLSPATVGLTPKTFNAVATALTLAPIVVSQGPVKAPDGAHDPNEQSRAYFVPIRRDGNLTAVYAAVALGWFFNNSIKVTEMRVVGAKIQRQPIAATDPADRSGDHQTAFLFDYEADYTVSIDSVDIRTARPVTARVDGTGFTIGAGSATWVQVPSGLRELSVADPSLWELGALGTFLKVVDISVRQAPAKQMVIRLRLNGNLDIVTAGDFVFVIPLVGDDEPSIEAFPSSISLNIGGVKATGTLEISKSENGSVVIGSLDLVLPSGLRLYGAVRVENLPGGQAKATIFGAVVRFAKGVPLFTTSMEWKGVDALVATHMKRVEPTASPAIPPALGWLAQVDGEVVPSIVAHKEAWAVEKDRSAIGVGALFQNTAIPDAFNINAMVVVERPGARILIFVKVNLLEKQKDNKEASKDLKTAILGVLDIDLDRDEITLSALATMAFKDMATLRAPLRVYFNLHKASAWQFSLGHHSDRATAKLDLFEVIHATASAYLMAAGDVIEKAPFAPGKTRDLPGVAFAFGLEAGLLIGSEKWNIFFRAALETYLAVSLGDGFYLSGYAGMSGELALFIVSVRASGYVRLEYLKDGQGRQALFAEGEICGRYKDFFITIEGCIKLRFGIKIAPPNVLPLLSASASFLSGANVGLHGQGVLGPIDAVLAEVVSAGDPAKNIPLDAVIALSMAQPPKIDDGATGFAGKAPRFNQNQTGFQFGSARGEYRLTGVRLTRHSDQGAEDVDYGKVPGRWWESIPSQPGGAPTPKTLALLTRNPLGVQNALADPAQVQRWLEAILGRPCDPAIGPQACWYALTSRDTVLPADGGWPALAVLPSGDIEGRIGRHGATDARFALERRPAMGTSDDRMPGYQAYPGRCLVEADPETGAPVAVLNIFARIVSIIPSGIVRGGARIEGDMWRHEPLDLLLAHSPLDHPGLLHFLLTLSDGTQRWISYNDLLNSGAVRDLRDPNEQQAFHQGQAYWRTPTEAFACLSKHRRYTSFAFRRITFDLATFLVDVAEPVHPTALALSFNGDGVPNSPIDVLIAGCRFTPLAEVARFEADRIHKKETRDSLADYLDAKPIPLLEPASDYQVRVDWTATIKGSAPVVESVTYAFTTTDEPPTSARPYLLATFPQAGERFHNAGDMAGLALGSSDALRILAQFPTARLKVTISDESGGPVLDPTGQLHWDSGVTVRPADLIDPLQPAPAGFVLDRIAGLPSALRQALIDKLGDGSLDCLGEIALPDSGLWIGLDAKLASLSAYHVSIEVVDDTGKAWPWRTPPAEPFWQWRFQTGLHRTLAAHAEQLAAARVGHKLLRSTDGLDFAATPGTVEILQEKRFEDGLAAMLGERLERAGETRMTLLWSRDKVTNQIEAKALLVESREPLYRETLGVAIEKIANDRHMAETKPLMLQSFDLATSERVAAIRYASSGFAALIAIDTGVDDLMLTLRRHVVDRIPAAHPGQVELRVPGRLLNPRSTPKL